MPSSRCVLPTLVGPWNISGVIWPGWRTTISAEATASAIGLAGHERIETGESAPRQGERPHRLGGAASVAVLDGAAARGPRTSGFACHCRDAGCMESWLPSVVAGVEVKLQCRALAQHVAARRLDVPAEVGANPFEEEAVRRADPQARGRRSPAACRRRTTARIVLARPCRPALIRKADTISLSSLVTSACILGFPSLQPAEKSGVPRAAFCQLRSLDSSDASTAVKPFGNRRRKKNFSPSSCPRRNRRKMPTARPRLAGRIFLSATADRRGKPVGTTRANLRRVGVSRFTD